MQLRLQALLLCLVLALALLSSHVQADDKGLKSSTTNSTNSTNVASGSARLAKLIPIFQVVKFQNAVCSGTGSQNGTCYTAAECTAKGGASSGSCASGYGVCCTFTLNCGGTSSQNCTYFQSTGADSGCCTAKICPCNDNICQLRLDFLSFTINGPTTSTLTVTKTTAGQTIGAGAVSQTAAGQCLMDQFIMVSPGNPSPPVICGSNTGQHMYLDASPCCSTLKMTLGSGTSSVSRVWNIKVTQYSCDFCNLAPDGCVQYFYGNAGTGTIMSYNFGRQLANQRQQICIRRESGTCRICYSLAIKTDFSITGAAAAAFTTGKSSKCCGFGTAGATTLGSDCIIVPVQSKKTAMSSKLKAVNFCGGGTGTKLTTGGSSTVCSRKLPFELLFLSGQYETAIEAPATAAADAGFKFHYQEFAC